ncbi:hypothetical protein AAG612_04140 [Citromicrobium bathyomarinum]|uniref:hypothetical protein n=1 Tax=Citromicrobium bathyomarinum TaxID=72174 RepID=UPI00315B2A27
MKSSKERANDKALYKKLDQLLEELQKSPTELTAYQAAKALETHPGGEFYRAFRNWQDWHAEKSDRVLLDLAPEAKARLHTMAEDFKTRFVESCIETLREVSGELDATATLRVTNAEHRLSRVLEESNALIEQLISTELERDGLADRVRKLEIENAELGRTNDRLVAQAEGRDDALIELRRGLLAERASASAGSPSSASPDEGKKRAHNAPETTPTSVAQSGQSADDARATEPSPSAKTGSETSSNDEGDGRKAHQAELSLVETATAQEAEVGHDDHD